MSDAWENNPINSHLLPERQASRDSSSPLLNNSIFTHIKKRGKVCVASWLAYTSRTGLANGSEGAFSIAAEPTAVSTGAVPPAKR